MVRVRATAKIWVNSAAYSQCLQASAHACSLNTTFTAVSATVRRYTRFPVCSQDGNTAHSLAKQRNHSRVAAFLRKVIVCVGLSAGGGVSRPLAKPRTHRPSNDTQTYTLSQPPIPYLKQHAAHSINPSTGSLVDRLPTYPALIPPPPTHRS